MSAHRYSGVLRTLDTTAGDLWVFEDRTAAVRAAAEDVATAVRSAISARGKAVVGLATGETPIPVYRRLVELYRDGSLSFQDVFTYNLDEYYPISPAHPNSYRSFMHNHLFGHVDLAANRTHMFDGTVPEAFADEHCSAYESWIEADGGLDLQLLGVGRNGHIGFNEPSDLSVAKALGLRSRLAELHPITRADAAKDFGGREQDVPSTAFTMGIATILAARRLLVLAFGPSKAEALASALQHQPSARIPASLVQTVRSRATWFVDESAASLCS